MANTIKNIEFQNEHLKVGNKYDITTYLGLLVPGVYFILLAFLDLYQKSVDMLSVIGGFFGGLLLLLTFRIIFRSSWAKRITISEIKYIQDRTAFTGHRSLTLKLQNSKIKNLYVEPSDIPELLAQFEKHNIEIKTRG